MPRQLDPAKLSRRERQIMDVIYARGEATVSEILAALPDAPMRGALRTLLGIMVRKGLTIRRRAKRESGKSEFVYRPAQSTERAARSAMKRVLEVFFGGSIERALAAHLSDPKHARSLTDADLKRLFQLIGEARERGD